MSLFLLSSLSTRFVNCFMLSTTSRGVITQNSRPAASLAYSKITTTSHSNSNNSNNNNNHFSRRKYQSMLFSTAADQAEIEAEIQKKGDEIRQLKADGIDKESLAPHIAELLALKAKIAPPPPSSPSPPSSDQQQPKKEKKKQNQKAPPKKKESDMSESELRAARLQKAEAMREAGVEPYEYTYDPTHNAMELQSLYDGRLEGGEEDEESDVAVAGRIMAKRVFGKLAFFTLQDESGTIQLHLEKNRLGDTFKVWILSFYFFHE